MSATASSSKLNTPQTSPLKRQRVSVSASADGTMSDDMDEEMIARKARRDARTIRNRESAQRSRNQRKAHLSDLEERVQQLEAENARLKESPIRDPSPSQSVFLPLDTAINLADVIPPPLDLGIDIKPIIQPTEKCQDGLEAEKLKAENMALRERVTLLEGLVKQVVALSNLGGLEPTLTDIVTPDCTTLFTSSEQPTTTTTLSPTLSLDFTLPPPNQTQLRAESTEDNLACHPAVMAISGLVPPQTSRETQQRARKCSTLISCKREIQKKGSMVVEGMKEMDGERLGMVARVVVALARRRGWVNFSSLNNNNNTRQSRESRRWRRVGRRNGMKG